MATKHIMAYISYYPLSDILVNGRDIIPKKKKKLEDILKWYPNLEKNRKRKESAAWHGSTKGYNPLMWKDKGYMVIQYLHRSLPFSNS